MEREWNAHGTQIRCIEVDAKRSCQETLSTTNRIEEAVMENNRIFAEKWEVTYNWIDHHLEETLLLKTCVMELKSLSGPQQTTLQHCQDTIAGLEETITQLVASVKKLEKMVCRCCDWLLLLGPHYAPVEEEDGLEYKTEDTSKGSYTTPPSTGGCSKPSLAPSCSPTLEDSDPETNAVLCTEELEAHIKAFLEEVEEDMEMSDLPPLENISPVPVLAPTIPSFIPFAMSTGQRYIPPKSLLWKVYHPYKDLVGRCHCEPGGWCHELPCSGQV